METPLYQSGYDTEASVLDDNADETEASMPSPPGAKRVAHIILLGESQRGKTSMVKYLNSQPIPSSHKATLCMDTTRISCWWGASPDRNEKLVTLWDTASSSRFLNSVKKYARRADGAIILANEGDDVSKFREMVNPKIPVLVASNLDYEPIHQQCDLYYTNSSYDIPLRILVRRLA